MDCSKWFSVFPSVITMNIVARLPPKDIFRCKLVCKEWMNMIEEPFLHRLHSQSAHKSLLFMPLSFDCDGVFETGYYELVEFRVDNKFDEALQHPQNNNSRWHLNLKPRYLQEMQVVNECNGFVCFGSPTLLYPYTIYNPMLRDNIKVDEGILQWNYSHRASYFGYSPTTNRYKIMRILLEKSKLHVLDPSKIAPLVEIQTVGSQEEWRVIGNAPPGILLKLEAGPLFFNSAVHWVIRGKDQDFITMFDYDKERFLENFPTPVGLGNINAQSGVHKIGLAILGNCFSLSHSVVKPKHSTSIWVMKEYGVKDSWEKLLVIEDSSCLCYRPIMQFHGDEILLEDQIKRRMYCYDPRKGEASKAWILGWDNVTKIMWYTPSFVSARSLIRNMEHKHLQQ